MNIAKLKELVARGGKAANVDVADLSELIALVERQEEELADGAQGCSVCPKETPYGPATCGRCMEAQPQHRAAPPSGWKMVPIEPTETMVIDGFESAPDKMFDGEDYPKEYDAMSGCQQAAFRARRCYAAMLAAAPTAPGDGEA